MRVSTTSLLDRFICTRTVRLTPRQAARLQDLVERSGCSTSQVIRRLIDRADRATFSRAGHGTPQLEIAAKVAELETTLLGRPLPTGENGPDMAAIGPNLGLIGRGQARKPISRTLV